MWRKPIPYTSRHLHSTSIGGTRNGWLSQEVAALCSMARSILTVTAWPPSCAAAINRAQSHWTQSQLPVVQHINNENEFTDRSCLNIQGWVPQQRCNQDMFATLVSLQVLEARWRHIFRLGEPIPYAGGMYFQDSGAETDNRPSDDPRKM